VTVDDRRRAVSCPSRVCDRDLRVENLGGVYIRAGDTLAKTSNFADFLEKKDFAWSIAVDTDAGRVVTTVLLAGETVAEDITNFFAILREREHSQLLLRCKENVRKAGVAKLSSNHPNANRRDDNGRLKG
jgi:hypothetical protein